MGDVIPAHFPSQPAGRSASILADALVWMDMASYSGQPGPVYQPTARIVDQSRYGHHASNYQTTAGNRGLVFDNVDDRISFGTNALNPRLAGSRGISAAVWLKPNGLASGSGRNQIFGVAIHSANSGISAWFTDSGKLVAGGRSQAADTFQSVTTASAVAAIDRDIFFCVVLDFTADRIMLWIEDQPAVSQSAVFGSDVYTPGTPTVQDTIGATSSGSYPLNAVFRSFLLVNKPLDRDQVYHLRSLMGR